MNDLVIDRDVFNKLADKYGKQQVLLAVALVEVKQSADTAYDLVLEARQTHLATIIEALFFTPSYERPQI